FINYVKKEEASQWAEDYPSELERVLSAKRDDIVSKFSCGIAQVDPVPEKGTGTKGHEKSGTRVRVTLQIISNAQAELQQQTPGIKVDPQGAYLMSHNTGRYDNELQKVPGQKGRYTADFGDIKRDTKGYIWLETTTHSFVHRGDEELDRSTTAFAYCGATDPSATDWKILSPAEAPPLYPPGDGLPPFIIK
ncbi:MAG: hypothetical protein JWL85_755, partial [Candidatus Saccharibacteria bacterium]|nr:hypothetical protein [Candidatus Saccharibacteria bacterium]